LNTLLRLEQLEVVHCAELDDPFPLAYDDAPGYGGFSAQKDRFFIALQAPGLIDHFNGRALPEVRLEGTRIDASRGVEIDIGIGDGNLDQLVM